MGQSVRVPTQGIVQFDALNNRLTENDRETLHPRKMEKCIHKLDRNLKYRGCSQLTILRVTGLIDCSIVRDGSQINYNSLRLPRNNRYSIYKVGFKMGVCFRLHPRGGTLIFVVQISLKLL
jgi:hypothetical protein